MKPGMMATLIRGVRHDKWKYNLHEIPFEIALLLPGPNRD